MATDKRITTREQGLERFALLIGSCYLFVAVLQFLVLAGVFEIPLVPAEPMGAVVLTVFGLVFLSGYHELNDGVEDGVAHVYVGVLISLIFGVLYLLVLGADAMEAWLIGNEDYSDWSLMDGLRPEIYLSLLSLSGAWWFRKELKLEELFTSGARREKE